MVITTMYSPPPPYNESCHVPIATMPSTNNPGHIRRQRKLICCCGAKTWAIIIASLQIFLSMTTLFLRFLPMSDYNQFETRGTLVKASSTELNELSDLEAYNKIYLHVSSDPNIQLLEGSMGLILGSILLSGAQLGKPLLLLMWLIATGIGLAIMAMALSVLLLWVILGGGMIALVIFLLLLIPFGMQSFCFWVVGVHRTELIRLKNPNPLPTTFDPFDPILHSGGFHSIHMEAGGDKHKQNLQVY